MLQNSRAPAAITNFRPPAYNEPVQTGRKRKPSRIPKHEWTHAVPNNAHMQLLGCHFGAITSTIPDSQAQSRGMGLRYMDCRL